MQTGRSYWVGDRTVGGFEVAVALNGRERARLAAVGFERVALATLKRAIRQAVSRGGQDCHWAAAYIRAITDPRETAFDATRWLEAIAMDEVCGDRSAAAELADYASLSILSHHAGAHEWRPVLPRRA